MTTPEQKTKESVKQAAELLALVVRLVASHGKMGMPSGELYASMMSCVSLENYEKMLSILERNKLIIRKGHLLIAGDVYL